MFSRYVYDSPRVFAVCRISLVFCRLFVSCFVFEYFTLTRSSFWQLFLDTNRTLFIRWCLPFGLSAHPFFLTFPDVSYKMVHTFSRIFVIYLINLWMVKLRVTADWLTYLRNPLRMVSWTERLRRFSFFFFSAIHLLGQKERQYWIGNRKREIGDSFFSFSALFSLFSALFVRPFRFSFLLLHRTWGSEVIEC